MIKPIATLDDILHRADWCGQLQQAGISTSLSEKMGCVFSSTPGKNSLPPCRKPATRTHTTPFAGSLFSLATLTGWGLIWLMLRERHLGGTIIPG